MRKLARNEGFGDWGLESWEGGPSAPTSLSEVCQGSQPLCGEPNAPLSLLIGVPSILLDAASQRSSFAVRSSFPFSDPN